MKNISTQIADGLGAGQCVPERQSVKLWRWSHWHSGDPRSLDKPRMWIVWGNLKEESETNPRNKFITTRSFKGAETSKLLELTTCQRLCQILHMEISLRKWKINLIEDLRLWLFNNAQSFRSVANIGDLLHALCIKRCAWVCWMPVMKYYASKEMLVDLMWVLEDC